MSSDSEYIRRGCIAILREAAGNARRVVSEVDSGWKPVIDDLPKAIDHIEKDVRFAYGELERCIDALIRLKALKDGQNEQ